ncbi:TetR family transcriptional regulator [Mycobacterium florentinum]|uniref:TetR family transcriptional regulator n=1 Tax=Mycobacterium florentinum TaxID=292462 RepID=A0A1X1TV72_MYCFL|nr:TetR/AcrR family transcriptional regulator [Mycobacterium florentinum]MCV7408243.1 TetR/AcrR family transcriptional regulator [Mycobacterium florentinum]ORV48481.1 TetR family transcriptional regulator [Mycobacterium florentinum]
MPKRSDSKDRMIVAARRLFREHGYFGTALSDVVAQSSAPRGSLYFHFPGGKEELATEVALAHSADAIAHINRAAGTTSTAAELIAAFLGRPRDEIMASDYREGCAVAPIVIESTPASAQLTDTARRGFQDVVATLAARLAEKGLPETRARQLALNAVTAMEGALILSRALRSPEPFDAAIAELTASADAAAGTPVQ